MSDLENKANGNRFHIPNFVINDPVFKKDFIEKPNETEKMLEVIKYDLFTKPLIIFTL